MVGGFAMPERLNRYSPNLFWSLEGFFYVPFSDSILSAHTKQGQFIHSMSGKGRKPVKKILAYAARLLTMRVEVQSPYNRIIISYNREGHSAFAVFLLSEYTAGLFLICGVVLRRSIWIFTVQTILHGLLPPQASRLDLYGQAFYSCSRLFAWSRARAIHGFLSG